MKRTVYIALASLLGLLLGLIFHAVIETLILRAGVSWSDWHPTYHVPFTVLTTVGGAIFGLWLGRIWWRIVYIEKRHHGWFRK